MESLQPTPAGELEQVLLFGSQAWQLVHSDS